MIDLFALTHSGKDFILFIFQTRRQKQRDGLADHLLCAVTKDNLCAPVPVGDNAVNRLSNDGIVG